MSHVSLHLRQVWSQLHIGIDDMEKTLHIGMDGQTEEQTLNLVCIISSHVVLYLFQVDKNPYIDMKNMERTWYWDRKTGTQDDSYNHLNFVYRGRGWGCILYWSWYYSYTEPAVKTSNYLPSTVPSLHFVQSLTKFLHPHVCCTHKLSLSPYLFSFCTWPQLAFTSTPNVTSSNTPHMNSVYDLTLFPHPSFTFYTCGLL